MQQRALHWIRTGIAYGGFPVTLVFAVGLVHFAFASGVRDGFVLVTGTILLCTFAILAMQRIHPAVQAWRDWGPDAALDILHAILSTGGGGEGVRALLFGVLYASAAALGNAVGTSLWPENLNWMVQLALALVIADFFAYWIHRLSHTWQPLWRFHALHHSSERLYTFSSGRNHPLHTALTYTAQMTPLILLGAPNEIIALLSVFTGVHGLLQHANIAFKPGALNWVLATADLHRWHHSVELDESCTNYGNNLVLWDVVFRTRYLPADRPLPEAVGLGEDANFPRDYFGQLASPWTWRG